jgi:hypothetical protein
MLLTQAPRYDSLRDPILHRRQTERAKPKQESANRSDQHPDDELSHSGTIRVAPLFEANCLSPAGKSRQIGRSAQCT